MRLGGRYATVFVLNSGEATTIDALPVWVQQYESTRLEKASTSIVLANLASR